MSTATKVPHIDASLKGRRVNVVFDQHDLTIEEVVVVGWVWIGNEPFLRVSDGDGKRQSLKVSAILMIEELDPREEDEESRE